LTRKREKLLHSLETFNWKKDRGNPEIFESFICQEIGGGSRNPEKNKLLGKEIIKKEAQETREKIFIDC